MSEPSVLAVHASVASWVRDPKTWITAAVLLFTLGGSVTVFRDNLIANDILVKETHTLVSAHQAIMASAIDVQKVASEQTQQLLKEIVRVAKVNCLNTAKDDISRRACVGIEHQ